MSNEIVTCQGCGRDVEKRDACGVGFGGRMTWTCCDCIKGGAMDKVFASIGTTIQKAIQSDAPTPGDALATGATDE